MRTLIYSIIFMSLIIFSCCPKTDDAALSKDKIDSLAKIEEKTKDYNPDSYEGEWLLVNDNLFDSILVFKQIEISDSSIVYGKKFIIKEENMTFKHLNPVPACGNGMFYMDSCNFKKDNKDIILYFKGGQALESNFIFNAKYIAQNKNENGFSLIRIKTINKEESSIYDGNDNIKKSL